MKVKVFGPLGLGRNLDEKGWLTVEEGTTFGQAIHKLGIPVSIARVTRAMLNGEVRSMKTVLKEGDVISFFSIIQGG